MIATYLSQLAQTSSALYSGYRPVVQTEFLSHVWKQWEHSAMIPNTLKGKLREKQSEKTEYQGVCTIGRKKQEKQTKGRRQMRSKARDRRKQRTDLAIAEGLFNWQIWGPNSESR